MTRDRITLFAQTVRHARAAIPRVGVVFLLAVAACGEPSAPSVETLSGSYAAIAFGVSSGPITYDVLADGGFLSLSLKSDGRTMGNVFVPGGGGPDFYEDLTGSWTLYDSAFALEHAASTFLRDMWFSVTRDSLYGDLTQSGVTIHVALTRTERETATVTIEPQGASRAVGETLTLSAAATGVDGRPVPKADPIAWRVSDPAVATVDAGGILTPRTQGDVTVFATSDRVTGIGRVRVAPAMRTAAATVTWGCGIGLGGEAWCWGSGLRGDGTLNMTELEPVMVAGAHEWQVLSMTGSHACGIDVANALFCWGWNNTGSLGVASGPETCNGVACSTQPLRILDPLGFQAVSAGDDLNCAVALDGSVLCWGYALALGDGVVHNGPSLPTVVSAQERYRTVSSGFFTACGLTEDGRALCWGDNGHWQIGDGSTEWARLVPTPVVGGLTFRSISVGPAHTCAVAIDNTAYCWGRNVEGQFGIAGAAEYSNVPVPVGSGRTFETISAGEWHTCGITTDGATLCWGGNSRSELGNGSRSETAPPGEVSGGHQFVWISSGHHDTCGTTATGVALCWGFNDSGQLGDGTRIDRWVPTRVFGLPCWPGSGLNSYLRACGLE